MGNFGHSDPLRLRPALPPRVAVRLSAAVTRLWCHPGTADVSRLLVSSSDVLSWEKLTETLRARDAERENEMRAG